MFRFFFVATVFVLTNGSSIIQNTPTVLISKYAKVSQWGSNSNNSVQQTGRSHKTQSIWTQRSTSSSNNQNQVAYQYPVYQKVDDEKVEKIPGIGEVIQDRFQVRPYFGYGKTKESELTYLPPNPASAPVTTRPTVSAPAPPPVPLAAPPSLPPFLPSPVRPSFTISAAQPAPPPVPTNLYDSPFSSYNPPSDQNTNGNQEIYPPNVLPSESGDSSSSNGDSYANIPSSNDGPYNYKPAAFPASSPKPFSMSFGGYGEGETKPHNTYYDNIDDSHGYDNSDKKPSMDSIPSHSHGEDEPPKHPPKSIDDIYYPPNFPVDQIHDDHKPHGSHDSPMDMGPDMPNGNGDTMDLVPPVNGNNFPKYLYDGDHYGHHIYEEVHHVTTTPAPEKKRVSTTNYSYYYLGRKLWYIPLYFSIYFMIYVTALIIKSIARHKVTFRNEWVSAHSRSGRDMTFDQIKTVDDIHRNFSAALDKAGKYLDIAM